MALRPVTDDQLTPALAAVVPPQPVVLTSAEITGLIGLFQTMLDRTERNILDRLDDNSRGATARWTKHDEDAAAKEARTAARFLKIETALDTTVATLQAHLDREHDEDIRMDARIRPIRGSLAWLWNQRRDIVIVLIGLGVLATFLVESFGRIVGPHVP
jgi:hypothetical protein